MTYEEEILARHSAPRLRRNVLPRVAKKLNMEFDAQYNKWTRTERDAFLDALYPEETTDVRHITELPTRTARDPGTGEPC